MRNMFLFSCIAIAFAPGQESESAGVGTVPQPKMPTVGRSIHVFPGSGTDNLNVNEKLRANGAPLVPATVTQVFPNSWQHPNYTGVNCVALNDDGELISLKSLQHKSTAGPGAPYWDWPSIN